MRRHFLVPHSPFVLLTSFPDRTTAHQTDLGMQQQNLQPWDRVPERIIRGVLGHCDRRTTCVVALINHHWSSPARTSLSRPLDLAFLRGSREERAFRDADSAFVTDFQLEFAHFVTIPIGAGHIFTFLPFFSWCRKSYKKFTDAQSAVQSYATVTAEHTLRLLRDHGCLTDAEERAVRHSLASLRHKKTFLTSRRLRSHTLIAGLLARLPYPAVLGLAQGMARR